MAIAAEDIDLCGERRCRTINIGCRQLAGGGQDHIGFSQRLGAHTCNHRFVIRSSDIDGHQFGCAISRQGGETIRVHHACFELVMGRVHGVNPFASRIQCELAKTTAASCRLGDERIGDAIHIGRCQRAGGGLHHIGFGDC